MENNNQHEIPVRIVVKKKGHGGHHGGAWKVAYADFVTAMMALFIVLWIVGQSKQVKQYVANYFKDPGAFFENTKGGGMFQGTSEIRSEEALDENLQREQKRLEQMAEGIFNELRQQPALKSLLDQIRVEIDKEGMRIELMESSQASFFDIGTSRLQPQACEILAALAREIGRLQNRVVLEGHTDSRQYSRLDGYTNFELSSDRANAARRLLVTSGARDGQIVEVRGYADTKLRNRENPLDETNRRISILIKIEGKQHHEQSAQDTLSRR